MLEDSSPQKYAELSQRLIQQAERELQSGDLMQASEKIWGSVAHAVKAVAAQRGWSHINHARLWDISGQIADEQNRPDLRIKFRSADSMHMNFYENRMGESEVRDGLESAKGYVNELEAVLASPPPAFDPQTQEQTSRLRRLTGTH